MREGQTVSHGKERFTVVRLADGGAYLRNIVTGFLAFYPKMEWNVLK